DMMEKNFAIGALQGYMLAHRIEQLVANVKELRMSDLLPETMAYLMKWHKQVIQQVFSPQHQQPQQKHTKNKNASPFWSRARAMLARLDGLRSTATRCASLNP